MSKGTMREQRSDTYVLLNRTSSSVLSQGQANRTDLLRMQLSLIASLRGAARVQEEKLQVVGPRNKDFAVDLIELNVQLIGLEIGHDPLPLLAYQNE